MRGSRALRGRIGMGCAAGAREVNVGWANRSESKEQWKAKRGGDQEHRLVRQQISDQAHEPCRDQRSGGSETLIAPQLPGQSQMTDYAKADGSNRWPKECARGSVEHQGSENHRKVRPNPIASAVTATMMAPSAARARFERTVSSSSPPGMRASKPARPLAVRTKPIFS